MAYPEGKRCVSEFMASLVLSQFRERLALNRCVDRAFSRDPKYYPDPEEFKPERYLMEDGSPNKNVLDPRSFTFGYGRR